MSRNVDENKRGWSVFEQYRKSYIAWRLPMSEKREVFNKWFMQMPSMLSCKAISIEALNTSTSYGEEPT